MGSFSDFDEAAPQVEFVKMADGTLVASFEGFRAKGTFKRCSCIVFRFSVRGLDEEEAEEEEGEVFFNDMAIFGLPAAAGAVHRGYMYDPRADLIVSPMLNRKRWGEEDSGKP